MELTHFLKEVSFLSWKKFWLVFTISITLGTFLVFWGNLVSITQVEAQAEESIGEEDVSLGTGKRKVINVDRQRVVFPHKMHQKMVLAIAGGEKEAACKICHHKKRKGRDPRACRRCHAGKMTKAKGTDLCLSGCHKEKGRDDLVDILKELPGKRTRAGKRLKMKDAFHLRCKNCHMKFRALNLDLDSSKYLAPVDACEGCHVPKSEGDRKAVEAEREAERKRAGDTIEAIKAAVKRGGAQE
jgi:Zn finger protein HypA/HybF involved in hydrogenase expression